MAQATVQLNIDEIDAVIEHNMRCISAYGNTPDNTVMASGKTVGFHKRKRLERARELQDLKDETWPK